MSDDVRIDAAVHPVVRSAQELREYMDPLWREVAVPGPERYQYLAPNGDACPEAAKDGGLAGSDLDRLFAVVLDAGGMDAAIMVPPGVGVLPSARHGMGVAAATNRWLSEQVLAHPAARGRCFGSIQVDPRDGAGAIAEIDRWVDDPAMVQVAVPLQAHLPYGHPSYFDLWQCCAERGLPVALQLHVGGSVEFHPSAAGAVQFAIDYDVLAPLNYAYHLGSMTTAGVFERLPDLRIVVVDGGSSFAPGIIWRLDKDWRPNRSALPGMRRRPSHYIREQVVFVLEHLDVAPTTDDMAAWSKLADGGAPVMFASHYPRWTAAYADADLERVHQAIGAGVVGGTARELYRLAERSSALDAVR